MNSFSNMKTLSQTNSKLVLNSSIVINELKNIILVDSENEEQVTLEKIRETGLDFRVEYLNGKENLIAKLK